MIEHLVISGGANIGFIYIGIFKKMFENKKIEMDKIKSIYCTSAGTLLAIGFGLKYSIEEFETYFIERPWNLLYKVDFNSIVRAIQEGGLFGIDLIQETVKPLLLGKDLTVDITLEEFYEYNHIDIHFYVTEYSELDLIDISHKTHPKWKLIDTIYASCCLPLLFDPFFHEGKYYIDGGVLKNYPLKQCMEENKDLDTIFGVYHNTERSNKDLRTASPYSNSKYRLFEYMNSFIFKMWTYIKHNRSTEEKNFQNHIGVYCDTQIFKILESFQSKSERKRLIEEGIQYAIRFYNENKSQLVHLPEL
uniref:PNPLA domain-containing protein n=1 Tax=viral metagenome TaxID=1070528 RepID=A0A6C0CNS1_9ZZZZ